ncbi:lytic transglycosylase domain-containing protein [Novosphingobium marinum]|uniref:Soluble lytic murein transglycosylase n=1 Tax=Novosphingobium marinum TaxID=1514948 RepID=A0A7Y9XYE3_9SPHN|nr:lytic transglycosylase domain-containing protein [Novosphingobium marinum]NYH95383.1 soluble lytic murein transglycosylase [Novosphingobium marinum]
MPRFSPTTLPASSLLLRGSAVALLAATACMSAPALAQNGAEWDQARARLMQTQSGTMRQAIQRWEMLSRSGDYQFSDYAGFIITYPGFPQEEKLRRYAEAALEDEIVDNSTLVAFFDRNPPLTNDARGRYALALSALGRSEAAEVARQAWRGGPLPETAAASIFALFGNRFTPADHDARMNALLWEGDEAQAARQISYVSPGSRDLFMERLSLMQGAAPGSLGLPSTGEMLRDIGYIYNRAVQARRSGNIGSAINLLATRPEAQTLPFDEDAWVRELLTAARGASADSAVRIAASIDDGFAPGTDISTKSFRLRDDYTSLMWLGGTKALWELGDARRAAPLFYRYGAAAQTPPTRSKGFYWAGCAMAQAGDAAGANRYFELAAQYPDHFYGLLSLERLGRPIPSLDDPPSIAPTPDERAAFEARPITQAVREVARGVDWRTGVQFFREIAEQAGTEAEHVLVADLAREIGRRDLAVILGQSAHTDGHGNFHTTSFPLIPTPPGTNWTMVHAISRQESQFAQNAISHAGARGLMQLMPATAREQAGKMGLGYSLGGLISDPDYNIRLGDGYFARMMDYYGGAYPLAVGAYNAGPGNVNRWLRQNGDPRNGTIDWIRWIEEIPIYETKNYIQKVLENAVIYEHLNEGRAFDRGNTPLSSFLGKRTPG